MTKVFRYLVRSYWSFNTVKSSVISSNWLKKTTPSCLGSKFSPSKVNGCVCKNSFPCIGFNYNTKCLQPYTVKKCLSKDNQTPNRGLSYDNRNELRENIWTIPNLLTVSRIVLTPVLGYCVLTESYSIACTIFVYAGVTDLLDGWIARSYQSQMSSFGSFLDPLADKLLISTLFVTLTAMKLIPVPLTFLIIARDVGLIAAAFYIRYISLPPPKTLQRYFDATHVTSQMKPLLISKINTGVQLVLVALTLAAPVFSYVDHPALQSLWFITAGTTIASGISYLVAKDTYVIYKNAKDKNT